MASISEIDTLDHLRTGSSARLNARALAVAGGLVIAAVLAVILVFSYANSERDRAQRAWQSQLGIVAESRLQAVEDWLASQFRQMQALGDNTSLKLYMTELALAGGSRTGVTAEPAQRGYLRNLLVAAAERGGFSGPVLGPAVDANVERAGIAGIALTDVSGRLLVATPTMPPADERVRWALDRAGRDGRALIDIHVGAAGTSSMGFVVPIFQIQNEGAGSAHIGFVVGIKPVAAELFPRLVQPGLTEESIEAVLVRRAGPTVEYISPLADGSAPFRKRLAHDTPDLASSFALDAPGGFAIMRDYRDVEVLATGRAVTQAPWALLLKIDAAEALADAEARRSRLIVILLLLVALVGAAIAVVWFRANSRNTGAALARYRDVASRFERQRRLLRLVTDSQPNEIAIVDGLGRYRFANRRVAADAGIDATDVLGKTVTALRGPEEARRVQRLNQRALHRGETVRDVLRIDTDGAAPRVLQSEHIPLSDAHDMPQSVLVVTEDITDAVIERERRERIMRDLVDTLVAVVDRRDPYAANHSRRTALVARAIADEMSLDPMVGETVEIAASVMNLGKILVPEALLTAERTLTPDELKRVRESILLSADLLQEVAFQGPVVETLRQMLEHIDGSGVPAGLSGDEILPSARVCAVANAFIGMVSPRAYRDGMDFDGAIDILMAEAGKQFDRGIVAALINHLDHHGGRERWADFRGGEAEPKAD